MLLKATIAWNDELKTLLGKSACYKKAYARNTLHCLTSSRHQESVSMHPGDRWSVLLCLLSLPTKPDFIASVVYGCY